MTIAAFRRTRRTLLAGMTAALCAGLAPVSALAQEDVASFFQDRTITIYVGFGPGGGYDLYARLAADFLGNHIPGNPSVIVENIPGGGGRLAVQRLYANAPQDGTAMSLIVQSFAMDSAIGALPGDVDASQFNAVGRLVDNYELGITWHTTGIETYEDAQNNEVVIGATGAGSVSYFVPLMLNDLTGTQFNVISGYEGVAAVRLAMESGEVDAMTSGLAGLRSSNPEWLTDGLINIVYQISGAPHPDYPDVPALGEFGENEDEQAMFRLVGEQADIGRALITTPNVPPERLEAIRRAFDAMIEDPAFQEAAAQRNLELAPLSGEDLQTVIENQMNISEDAANRLRTYVMGS